MGGCYGRFDSAFTMDSKADVSRFTQSLLDYQQSIEDWSRILESRIKAGEPLPELPALEIGPPDNAEPARHLDYWRKSWNRRNGQSPGPAVREKILQAVQSEPSAIPEVLQTLPQNEHAAVAVARLQSALPQFAFLPMKEIKGIYFTSADMWVDEQEGMIYAAVEGDLLKIPLSFE